jgi:hypothetical protein
MKPPYYLLEDGQATGPHSLLVLRQKAEIRVISPESSVCPLSPSDTPWMPIRAIPELHDFLFPPKPAPALRATASFDAANVAADSTLRTVEVDHILRDNTARLAVSEHFEPGRIRNRRARRNRRYLLTVALLSASAWTFYQVGPFPRSDMIALLFVSGVVLVSLLCYWIMYHLADLRS